MLSIILRKITVPDHIMKRLTKIIDRLTNMKHHPKKDGCARSNIDQIHPKKDDRISNVK